MTQSLSTESTSRFNVRSIISILGPFIGLFAVIAYFSYLEPKTFPTMDNLILVLRNNAVVGLAAIGMTVIIISGGIDLSAGSQIAMASVIAAWFTNKLYSPWLTIAATTAIMAFTGLIIGGTISKLKLLPFIVTLGAMTVLRGVALMLTPDQGGTLNFQYSQDEAQQMGIQLTSGNWPAKSGWLIHFLDTGDSPNYLLQVPYGVWFVLIVAILTAAMLHFTRFGRHVYAIGSNEQTAVLCGVRADMTKILVYVFGAVLTGLAGVLFFGYNNLGDATGADGWELRVIAGVVIGGASLTGGRGSIFGSMVGVLIIALIDNGCTKHGYSTAVQKIVTGAIIVVAVALDRLRQKSN